ncbi:MAG: DUF5916 domain-containing protein [Gemmatimonadota bacterium]
MPRGTQLRAVAGVLDNAHVLTAALLAINSALPAQQVPSVEAVRADVSPVVDGVLDEPAWSRASRLTEFIQFEPRRGEPAMQPTEAMVLYDSVAVYFGFRLRESGSIQAELTRRDADMMTDDAVFVVLDTYSDRQSGYVFAVNPLGTKSDGRIAGDGREVDFTWDGEWTGAAARTAGGWTAEIAIPLSTLRYAAGEGRVWGLNVGRSRRRELEVSFWSGPLETAFRVSGAGLLVGLDLPPPLRRREIIVYGLSRAEQGVKTRWDAGLDARYRLTPAVALDATVNPDFATIEADREQVNLTRFELSLPEKRPFFLEGAELFRQRIRTFYSRRIADLRGGGKVHGKIGPWTIYFLGADEAPGAGEPHSVYGVSRLQRDVGRSSLGLTWAGREAGGAGSGSVSLDATLFFSERLGLTAQAIASYGSGASGSHGFFLRPSYDSPTGHFHVRYTELGEGFGDDVNPVGFVQDDDRRELDSAIEKALWPASGPAERIQYLSNYNVYWGQSGVLRSWQVDQSVSVDLRNRWSASVSYTEEFKRFETDFRNRDVGTTIGYNTRALQSASVGYRTGKSFGSDFDLITLAAAVKPTDSSALEYELERLVLDPDPADQTTWIHVVRGNVYFTPDLYLQLFYQNSTRLDRHNVQTVFVYRYRPPFGAIQIAFQRGTAAFGQASSQGNTLFLKVSGVL